MTGRTAISTYGPLLLALYMLMTTRWGSYILPGPPYAGDLVLVVLIAERVAALAGRGRLLAPNDPWAALAAGGLLLLGGVSLLFGEHSLSAARDAAPFAYAILVFLTAPLVGEQARRATRLLSAALYVHLAWVTLALTVPDLLPGGPSPGNDAVALFSLRSDMDGLVNGVAAAIGLYRVLCDRGGTVLFTWGLTLVVAMHSRSALVATAALLACAALYVRSQRRRERTAGPTSGSGLRPVIALAALAAVLATTFTVAAPTSLDRLTGTFGTPGNLEEGARAAGTTQARLRTWITLEQWIVEDRWRASLGAGFGGNVMTASGAGQALVRTYEPDLRAPHNYLLTAWARLGLAGLALVLALFVAGARLAWLVARGPMTEVDVLAGLLAIGIPIAAAVGVIMESPFGAIPYYWAIGQLSSVVAMRVSRPQSRRAGAS